MRNVCVFILLLAMLSGCGEGIQPAAEPAVVEQPAAGMAPEAKAHLDELLTLMQTHSINRLTIDWDDFRTKVYAQAATARSIEHTLPAIREALLLLGDGHSFYQANGRGGASAVTRPCSSTPVDTPEVPATIGYISVGAFSGSTEEAAAFTERIQQAIKAADQPGVTGWLIDLRRNSGGNMWPMVAGLSPLLGEGAHGSFVDPTGAKVVWEIRGDGVYYDGRLITQNKAWYRLQSEASRVAVLTDNLTASSGEAVAIAFKGRAGTRFFGTPTCGLSTANRPFPLSDGGRLYLTVAVMADRTGTTYGGPVVPDEAIEDPDKVVERALEWLRTGH